MFYNIINYNVFSALKYAKCKINLNFNILNYDTFIKDSQILRFYNNTITLDEKFNFKFDRLSFRQRTLLKCV